MTSLIECEEHVYNAKLHNAIRGSGYEVAELADMIGVGENAIYNWQSLRAWPRSYYAKRLARILGVKTEDIFPKSLRELYYTARNDGDCAASPCRRLDKRVIKRQERTGAFAQLPKDVLEHEELREMLDELMYRLDSEQMAVIGFRYAMFDGIHHTLEDTGKLLGISRETARMKENQALRRLNYMISEYPDAPQYLLKSA